MFYFSMVHNFLAFLLLVWSNFLALLGRHLLRVYKIFVIDLEFIDFDELNKIGL